MCKEFKEEIPELGVSYIQGTEKEREIYCLKKKKKVHIQKSWKFASRPIWSKISSSV